MPIRGQSLALQWLAERPDTEVCAAVRGILVRAVWSFYERRARRLGRSRPRAGAAAFVQRIDSALRINLTFTCVDG
jgi:hypothetical protein